MPRKSDVPRRKAALWDALGQGAPELIEDADVAYFKAVRSPRKKPEQPERDEVQRPLVIYLRRHLPPDSVVFAIPNLARSRAQTFALMRDGMLPGVPDLCVITLASAWLGAPPTKWIGFIECKRPKGGNLSAAQLVVQLQLRALGFPVLAECRSVVQARDWLREQGVEIG